MAIGFTPVTDLNGVVLSQVYHTLFDVVNEGSENRASLAIVIKASEHYLCTFEAVAKQIDLSPRKEEFWVKNLPEGQRVQYEHAQRYLVMLKLLLNGGTGS